jgi:UDP-glucose 4-epimerase
MRVLLTGAAGLIGRATSALLARRGHQVLATDLRPMPARLHELRWQRLDVRHGASVKQAFRSFEPDAVVHLAARHFIPDCNRFPVATLNSNVIGLQSVIEGLREIPGRKLVFASSAAVYGASRQPLRETAALDPDDVYGVSKLVGEQLCELASRQLPDAQLVGLRLFNTIGPEDPNQHLIPRLIEECSRGADRVRLGNLETVRDYIYVEDVAEAILAALQLTTHGFTVVNVGTGVGRSVREVVAAFERLLDRPLQVASTAAQRRAVDRPLLVADRTRAGELFGWEPRVSFQDGLARVLRAAGLPVARTTGSVGAVEALSFA